MSEREAKAKAKTEAKPAQRVGSRGMRRGSGLTGWLFSAGVFGMIFVGYMIAVSKQTKKLEHELMAMIAGPDLAGPDRTALPGPPEGHIVAQQVDFNDAVVTVRSAVVSVRGYQGVLPQGGAGGAGTPGHAWRGQGTGVVVSPAGYVVTALSVAGSASRFKVTRFDKGHTHIYDAEVMRTFPEFGLAVLRLEVTAPLPTSLLGDSSSVRMGDWVVVIGSPLGMRPITVAGIIGSLARPAAFKPSMRLGKGFMGAPLVSSAGEVIGVMTQDGLAVVSNQVRGLLDVVPVPYLPSRIITGGAAR